MKILRSPLSLIGALEWEKSKNGANFLGASLKIRFQTLITQQNFLKLK